MFGDNNPEHQWSDVRATASLEEARAWKASHSHLHGHKDFVRLPITGSVPIRIEVLRWWRELVDLNPADLAPRLDNAIENVTTIPQATVTVPGAPNSQIRDGGAV